MTYGIADSVTKKVELLVITDENYENYYFYNENDYTIKGFNELTNQNSIIEAVENGAIPATHGAQANDYESLGNIPIVVGSDIYFTDTIVGDRAGGSYDGIMQYTQVTWQSPAKTTVQLVQYQNTNSPYWDSYLPVVDDGNSGYKLVCINVPNVECEVFNPATQEYSYETRENWPVSIAFENEAIEDGNMVKGGTNGADYTDGQPRDAYQTLEDGSEHGLTTLNITGVYNIMSYGESPGDINATMFENLIEIAQ